MWPLFVAAGKIHGPSCASRRTSRIDCARWKRGMRRRALFVLPWVMKGEKIDEKIPLQAYDAIKAR
jgi:hypothetical protein